MTDLYDIQFKSKFRGQNNDEFSDRTGQYVRLTHEQAVARMYKLAETALSARNNSGERFWKIINFTENFIHIVENDDDFAEHVWKIIPSVTPEPGFWVHDTPTENIEAVVDFLNGDDHDQSKVEFVKNNKRYRVVLEEV